ncbi:MAG: hypothetical protein R3F34_17725 [Planctomycetota bacterium]
MKAVAWIFALLVVLASALLVREHTAVAHVVPDGVPIEGGSHWLVDDNDAAYHLRRVQVALATGRVPAYDTYINAPEGSAVPWPTFFDGVLTALVELLAEPAPDGPPEIGGYTEGSIDDVLVHVPPMIGVLAALGVFLALLALASRGGSPFAGASPWCAVAAAAVYASVPTAVLYGSVARIDHHVATAMFIALQLAATFRALIARDAVEVSIFAVLSGAAGAFGVLTWLAHGVVLAACGIGYAVRALAVDPVESRRGWQGGAASFAIAALVVLPPALASPWNETQPGSLVNLSTGVPIALLAAAVPFVVYGAVGRRTSARVPRAAVATLALVVVVLVLPNFVSQVREGLAWSDRSNRFMSVINESAPMSVKAMFGVPGVYGHLGALVYALPVAALVALLGPLLLERRGWRSLVRPERVVLLLVAAIFFTWAVTQRRFANSFAVPMGLLVGVAVLDVGRVFRRMPAHAVVSSVLLVGVAAGAWTSTNIALRGTHEEMVGNAHRIRALVDGLRWMRSNTESPGNWNEPTIEPSYTVLSSWSDGHWIEFHARRPSVSTNFGSFVGHDKFVAAPRALSQSDPDEFVRQLEALHVRYVVMRPPVLSWFAEEMRIAERTDQERAERPMADANGFTRHALDSAYFRLTLHDLRVGDVSPWFPAMELVWTSPFRIGMNGALADPSDPLAGPSLSIWRLMGE